MKHKPKITIICKECKKEFEVLWARRQRKFCCSECSNKNSKGKKHSWRPSTIFKKGHPYYEKEGTWLKKSIAAQRKRKKTRKKYKRYIHTTWTPAYKKWRESVFKRDEYTCQECDQHGGTLQAHHINDWANHKQQRYTIKNGVTLCVNCHKYVHRVEREAAKYLKNYVINSETKRK